MTQEEKELLRELKYFLVQAINGTIMAPIRMGLNITKNSLKIYFIKYLNICWHSFNRKDDSYLVDTFNKMLKFNIIKGSVCLIHWFKTIGDIMIDRINLSGCLDELNKLKTIDEKRENVNHNIELIFDSLDINFDNVTCQGNKCDNSYDDGQDIFSFI